MRIMRPQSCFTFVFILMIYWRKASIAHMYHAKLFSNRHILKLLTATFSNCLFHHFCVLEYFLWRFYGSSLGKSFLPKTRSDFIWGWVRGRVCISHSCAISLQATGEIREWDMGIFYSPITHQSHCRNLLIVIESRLVCTYEVSLKCTELNENCIY